jgi:rhodanese-related sulfurtransferase
MENSTKITKDSTMQEVLDAYPSAQRALFRKYHIGGCHSCGYEPSDILEQVAKKHDITDMNEVLNFIEEAERIDQKIKVSPEEVAEAVNNGQPIRIIDVRFKEEWDTAHIPNSTLITEELSREIMRWPKDTPMVFVCHQGLRSMDAASYFAGHGFTNARSMTGGIDAWSQKVDSSVPRYEVAPGIVNGKSAIRPLRSVVSQAQGCISE